MVGTGEFRTGFLTAVCSDGLARHFFAICMKSNKGLLFHDKCWRIWFNMYMTLGENAACGYIWNPEKANPPLPPDISPLSKCVAFIPLRQSYWDTVHNWDWWIPQTYQGRDALIRSESGVFKIQKVSDRVRRTVKQEHSHRAFPSLNADRWIWNF